MRTVTSIFAALLTIASFTVHAQWQEVGTPLESMLLAGSPDIAFDAGSGQPVVSFSQNFPPVFLVGANVTAFDGTDWGYVASANFTTSSAQFLNLEYNPSTGFPYVAFADGSMDNKVSVMAFDGTSWQLVGAAGFTSDTVRGVSLAFHPTTYEPYVGYQSSGDAGKTSVQRFDGTNWVYVGAQAFSAGDGGLTALEFDPATGEPYLTYLDNTIGVVVQKFDGTSWQYLPDFPNMSSGVLDAEFSPSGELHVLFSDQLNGKLASLAKFDGTSWSYVGNEGFSANGVITGSVLQGEVLAFSSTGTPYAILREDPDNNSSTADNLIVMSYNGSAWGNVGNTIVSGVSIGYSIGISPADEPFLVYADQEDNFTLHIQKYTAGAMAPNPPTDLQASLQKVASNNVQLTWTDNSNNEDGFEIERGTDGVSFSSIGTVNADVTVFDDLGLNPNTTYYYRVSAYNTVGSSATSNVVQILTEVTVGIADSQATGTAVYPNPSNGEFTLNLGSQLQKGNVTMDIFSVAGARVHSAQLQHNGASTIHTLQTSLTPGIYQVRISNNQSMLHTKLVIR